MKKGYFVLEWSDSGLRLWSLEDKRKLLEILDKSGDFGSELTGDYDATFLSEVPKEIWWDGPQDRKHVIIIKGEIVVPQPVKTVITYDIE